MDKSDYYCMVLVTMITLNKYNPQSIYEFFVAATIGIIFSYLYRFGWYIIKDSECKLK